MTKEEKILKDVQQTANTFSFKWGEKRNTYSGNKVNDFHIKWSIERFFSTRHKMDEFLNWTRGKSLMDAGCGNGFTASVLWGEMLNELQYLGVDNANGALEEGRKRFEEEGFNGEFRNADISNMSLKDRFDIILSSGVIHHTEDPKKTFFNLINHLKPGGRIIFYIYKKKAPVREFVDDFVRDRLEGLSQEDAWNKMIPLTELGIELGKIKRLVKVENEIELLGIPKGEYKVQELLYWYFFKAFYREEYTLDQMNNINFDWYCPKYCFRFEPEEIDIWLTEAGLLVEQFNVLPSGIGVIAKSIMAHS
ncbi:class I SAM-dependent methyltransferase [Roseivirga sp. E12]|uniref:class I SAM-dependent methyltransferase n=1 Tax=Roseivirga sp. E12 TaxID=2819237 RepID=UPI001ABD0C24|nr:class I SAM-dependent methyltransferase [Roseivirga sp. E12]MBO3697271.1 class I SAM-dependent methyltransferase [Roseivirga sp. E12]